MLQKIANLEVTFDIHVNLRKRLCDWCDAHATWAVSELSTRSVPWTDYACRYHRDRWFPFEGVCLVKR